LSSAISVIKEISFLWIQLGFNIEIFDIIYKFVYAKVKSLKLNNSIIYLVINNLSIGYKAQETLNIAITAFMP